MSATNQPREMMRTIAPLIALMVSMAAWLFPSSSFGNDSAIRPTAVVDLLKQPPTAFHIQLSPNEGDVKLSETDVFQLKPDGSGLTVTGRRWGYIRTLQSYRDYRAVMEYRFLGPTSTRRELMARDSGFFVHAFGPDGTRGHGTWLPCIEVQVMEGAVGDFIVLGPRDDNQMLLPLHLESTGKRAGGKGIPFYDPAGDPVVLPAEGIGNNALRWQGRARNYREVRDWHADTDADKPVGEWNTLEVICDGDSVEVIVNGRVVNRGTKAKPSEGWVCLQSEGAEIEFRKWELHPLHSVTPAAIGEVRKLADGFKFTEGPAWDAKADMLYFSDIPNKELRCWTEAGGVKVIRKGAQASNGIVVDAQGGLLFCEIGGRRIVRCLPGGEETTLADSCEGKPLAQPNDLWLAPDGAVYFTLPRLKPEVAKGLPADAVSGTVCRISPDGKAVTNVGAAIGIKGPNGVVGSSDGKRLYYTDVGKCWVARIQPDGSLADKRVAADKGSDGLALDEYGNLYTTARSGIMVFGPDAKQVAQIAVPEEPANLKFGGNEGRTLFITARTGLYAVEMNVRGDGFPNPNTK